MDRPSAGAGPLSREPEVTHLARGPGGDMLSQHVPLGSLMPCLLLGTLAWVTWIRWSLLDSSTVKLFFPFFK